MSDGQHRPLPVLLHMMMTDALEGLKPHLSDPGFMGDAYVPITWSMTRAMYGLLEQELAQTAPDDPDA